MDEIMRKMFEEMAVTQFGDEVSFSTQPTGQYANAELEAHWQTFQDGWLAMALYLKNKQPSKYSDEYTDLVSDGGLDPRGC